MKDYFREWDRQDRTRLETHALIRILVIELLKRGVKEIRVSRKALDDLDLRRDARIESDYDFDSDTKILRFFGDTEIAEAEWEIVQEEPKMLLPGAPQSGAKFDATHNMPFIADARQAGCER